MSSEKRIGEIRQRYRDQAGRLRRQLSRRLDRLTKERDRKITAIREGATALGDAGLNLIASSEGFVPYAYRDVGGVWTIGYGHTGGVQPGQKITKAEALKLLAADAGIAVRAIRDHVRVRLNQPRFDALTSLIFNIGVGAFVASTLLRLLNQSDYHAAGQQFLVWVKVGTQTVQGLVNRRRAELALWQTKG